MNDADNDQATTSESAQESTRSTRHVAAQIPSQDSTHWVSSSALKKRTIVGLVCVTIVFVLVSGYALASYLSTVNHPLRETDFPGQWIQTAGEPSHAGFFRKRFDLPGPVRHAWIKIAANNAFEISVNGNPQGRIYMWRPTRPFQTSVSEKGQILMPQNAAMSLNFPREYQWDGHDSWKLPSYINLGAEMNPGKNVIAIELESRHAPAQVTFNGEIELWNGTVIPFRSDETWLAEPAVPGPQLLDWTDLYYWDKEWRNAVPTQGPAQSAWRSHPPQIYTESFDANWLRHPSAASEAGVTFHGQLEIDKPIDEAWIRLLTNRVYGMIINGTPVNVAWAKPPDLDNGDWVLGRGSAIDPFTQPVLLDPDEVDANFVGKRFESPRNAAPGLEEFIDPNSPKITPFRNRRTTNRAQAAGVYDPKRTLAQSRRTPDKPELYPERPRPNALKRDRSNGGYLSYSIANLLHRGTNTITLHCVAQPTAIWPAQIALDGGVITTDGGRIELVGDENWTASEFDDALGSLDRKPVSVAGPAQVMGQDFPAMQYRGNSLRPQSFSELLPATIFQVAMSTMVAIACIVYFSLRIPEIFVERAAKKNIPLRHVGSDEVDDQWPLWASTCQVLYAMLLSATVAIGAGLMLECTWIERHEILWFIEGSIWIYIFMFAFAIAFLVGLTDTLGRVGLSRLRDRGRGVSGVLRNLPRTRMWIHMIVWILLLGTLARAYKMDLQPLDDDEYASTQAVMSILETGVPGFVAEHVFYTRSPMFHYLTAAVAWPMGGNLWSLRYQSVFWGVATAWLTYMCGSRLLGSPWVGMLSMLLVAVHPFEIFTGHVIRFYQLQQFFALLTMYCFCRGFVTNQSQRYRIITMIVFLMAVMSQEISVAIGPSLLLCYLVFAKDFGWQRNIQLGLVCLMVIAIIGLDFVVFQTLCLTRTEGVSPSAEASVKPHFWFPLNFLSILIGYSRLHVVPSLFLLAGLPLICRERNRNTLTFLTFLFSGVVMINLLVTTVSLRYMYWLFPVWILLSVNGIRLVFASIVSLVYPSKQYMSRYTFTICVCCGISTLCILGSWSLWRVPGSYELRILGDSTGAMRWIRSQKRPDDRIAVTEPHTHCAFMEGGNCDYDIAIPLLYDFAVVQDGRLVDRNGAGEVISSLDQLIGVLSKGERVWIALNREKFRTRGKNMRWEYPGARFELFVRRNCELRHRTYLWSVYLWDPARGHFRSFQLQE